MTGRSSPTGGDAPRRRFTPALVALWIATFAVVTFLVRGIYEGGSIFAVVGFAAATTAATALTTVVQRRSAHPPVEPAGPGAGAARDTARVVLGLVGALAAFVAAMLAWILTGVASTGCSFHCEVEDRSLPLAAMFGVATALLSAACAWSAGWAVHATRRARRTSAGFAAAFGAVAAAGLVLASGR